MGQALPPARAQSRAWHTAGTLSAWELLLNPAQEAVPAFTQGGCPEESSTVLLPLQTRGFGAEKEGLWGQVSGA